MSLRSYDNTNLLRCVYFLTQGLRGHGRGHKIAGTHLAIFIASSGQRLPLRTGSPRKRPASSSTSTSCLWFGPMPQAAAEKRPRRRLSLIRDLDRPRGIFCWANSTNWTASTQWFDWSSRREVLQPTATNRPDTFDDILTIESDATCGRPTTSVAPTARPCNTFRCGR
jgi:hypothetical protein